MWREFGSSRVGSYGWTREPKRRVLSQEEIQARNSAEAVFNQALVLFEVGGIKTADPRLPEVCKILGLPDPTTQEGLAEIRRLERQRRNTAPKTRWRW